MSGRKNGKEGHHHKEKPKTDKVEGDPPPPKNKGDASNNFADELHLRWQGLLQRVRVHEMLKCLQSEHKKLQVLRDHTDLDEIMKVRFDQLGAGARKLEPDEIEFYSELEDEEENREGEPEKDFDEKEEKKKNMRKLISIDERMEMLNKAEAEILKRDSNVLFLKTQIEEEEGMAEIYPNLKRVLADPKYVSKAAIRLFRTRTTINEQEFNAILDLCDDKVEQQALKDAYDEKKNRERYLHNADEKKRMLYDFINSTFFVRFMLITIIVSIVGIFLLTFETIAIRFDFALAILDACIIGIFVVEALFKILIYKETYFRQLWNILDTVIIVVYFLEVAVELITKTLALSTDINANIYFKFLKSLRALRLLRIIKFLPNLQVIVTTVFHSMLSMGSIAVLMSLFIFVFAVLGRGLFFEESPKHFGNIWYAFVTLFQLLTLDDWFDLLDVIRNDTEDQGTNRVLQYWTMFTYLFCYIVIEYFVFLNLFVAVLVDNFQLTLADAEIRKQREALVYLEGKEKYIKFSQGGMNPNFSDEPIQNDNEDLDNILENSEYVNAENLELSVEDYFPVRRGTRENQLIDHIFKDLAAIDFERYLWKRRLALLHVVMDRALQGNIHNWSVQDAERLSAKTKEELAEAHKHEVVP